MLKRPDLYLTKYMEISELKVDIGNNMLYNAVIGYIRIFNLRRYHIARLTRHT
jgi:hypothetical protein